MHLLLAAALLATGPDAGGRDRLLGLQLSAGFPQGFAASVAVRPLPWLRLHGGGGHNVLGPGIQGGVTLVPWRFAVAPTLTLEAGHFFETDISDDFSGTFPDAFDPSLREFGYQFYSAQLGVEFGSQRSFLFFLRAGLAWVRSGLDGVQDYVEPGEPDQRIDVSDVKLRATVPTVNLGFVFFVW